MRKVKTRHQRLYARVETVREELQRFLEDDDDMAKMCLTRKKEMDRMVSSGGGDGREALPVLTYGNAVDGLQMAHYSYCYDDNVVKMILTSKSDMACVVSSGGGMAVRLSLQSGTFIGCKGFFELCVSLNLLKACISYRI